MSTPSYLAIVLWTILSGIPQSAQAQISSASQSGFTWISTQNVADTTFGSGYTMYCAAWPIFQNYPGPRDFQTGLSSSWMTTQKADHEPSFYTTIEGGLGWWHDTRFGTKTPKFIMGGVSYNFYAWANGPGAGRSDMLPNGQRDWSTPGGKYGVAQLSNKLLWAPDGLNMAQSLNGELLGYGYIPLPLTEPIDNTQGTGVKTGNQCWTLFLNSTNFKGPATFFLPTFWTEPALSDPSLEGLFLDTKPSDPNVAFGIEHAGSPAIVAKDADGNRYAKVSRIQFPANNDDRSMILNQVSVYSPDALWNDMESWFNGGPAVPPGIQAAGIQRVPFVNNGGSMVAEIQEHGPNSVKKYVDLNYIDNVQLNTHIMGFEYDLNVVEKIDKTFRLPEYFRMGTDSVWRAIPPDQVPAASGLLTAEVPTSPRPEIPYVTPLDPECHWQDPEGPWNKPGPAAGPYQAELGDGTTVTYYWYRFVDQPAIIHARLPEDMRAKLQERVELIHSHWSHTDEYLAPPAIGRLATLDPAALVQPPAGMEIGYVPIVSRQEKTRQKVRVFVLAGQSNMQGFGAIHDENGAPGTLEHVLENDTEGKWSHIGTADNWTTLENAYLYFERDGDIIKDRVSVGQGAYSEFIGPELAFAHQLDDYYEDPILIIKTAWGGKSLAEDFRPPSAGGQTGEYYRQMIQTVKGITENLSTEFPDLSQIETELTGFVWFQGWNDGASDDFLQEYESNLHHLVQDVRKDLGHPRLPVIIASAGQGGYEVTGDTWVQSMQNIVAVAQENVGCNDSIYGGHLGFVNSKPHYRNAGESPADAIHHYNNHALTFLHIGKDMGDEMILAINEMAFCYQDCADPIAPEVVSIGNRVWNDLNRNGIEDPDEPGIPGVSLVIWSDSDGDGIPDWQGFGGVRVTDEQGYYRFSGLPPGNYVVFVWQVNNWGPGEPLEHFVSTSGFEPNANNDVDFDNNGSGNPFSDIMSGIVTLGIGEEPLNDGDPFNCYFDYDGNGNNSVDFGFYNPNVTSTQADPDTGGFQLQLFPMPVRNAFTLQGNMKSYELEIYDAVGRIVKTIQVDDTSLTVDVSNLPAGLYIVRALHKGNRYSKTIKMVKI